MNFLKNCRVCGFECDDFPWGEDGTTASFLICDCCGTEFGYEDLTRKSTLRKRQEWIDAGCPWFDDTQKPYDWDLKIYLSFVPPGFREP